MLALKKLSSVYFRLPSASAAAAYVHRRPSSSVAQHQATKSNNNNSSSSDEGAAKNPLKRFLLDKIRLSGPISVAEYMQIVAGSPGAGYYSKNDGEIFGARGDFVTSPEFTQMMGELLGVWLVNEFFKLSHSGDWQLVELGPGSGCLMHDVLGVMRKFRLTENNLEIRLVETSRQLIREQATILCGDDDTFTREKIANLEKCSKTSLFGPEVHWHDNLNDLPSKFSLVVCHEFFDALPVHKFKRTERGWREVLIGLDDKKENLVFNIASGVTIAQKLYLTKKLEESTKLDDLEISPASAHICSSLADRINQNGGAVLIVDYGASGAEKKTGDTFRAYRNHKLVDPLQNPGRCDVTCDVDFDYLTENLRDRVTIFGPLAQQAFLENLGVRVRFDKLLRAAGSDQERDYLQKSFDLLTDPQKMGARFKAMAFFPKVIHDILQKVPPSGFCPLS